MTERLVFAGLLALLVWVPVPLGSNRGWAWALLVVWAFALLGAWLVEWARRRVRVSDALAAARPAFLLLALWLGLIAVTVVPLPREWVAVLSPEVARLAAQTDILGIAPSWATLSVDPHATWSSLLKTAAYTAVFFLVLAVVNTRERAVLMGQVLVYAAVAHAVYAVVMHLGGVKQMWFGTRIDHSAASGFYANRNHFAGMLYMTLAIGIGLLVASVSEGRARSWKAFAVDVLDWILSPKMVLRLGLCILVIALTTTHSRMGNTAFFASLLIAGVVGIVLSKHAPRKTTLLLASLVVLDLAIVGSWFGVEKLAERIQATTVEEVQQRETPAWHALAAVRDHAMFGTGAGTFEAAFPRYRPEQVRDYYDYAHNDYAQFAAEAGVVGFALLGALVVWTLVVALRAQWSRRDPVMRGMSFACLMGVTAMLIHAGFDFNLQIPANAVLFMVLLALGWISLYTGRRSVSDTGV